MPAIAICVAYGGLAGVPNRREHGQLKSALESESSDLQRLGSRWATKVTLPKETVAKAAGYATHQVALTNGLNRQRNRGQTWLDSTSMTLEILAGNGLNCLRTQANVGGKNQGDTKQLPCDYQVTLNGSFTEFLDALDAIEKRIVGLEISGLQMERSEPEGPCHWVLSLQRVGDL